MRRPPLDAVVERRLLVNYRLDPQVAASLLPAPFRPQLVGDVAVAGICLIRLGRLRPRHLPGVLGLRSENTAHRIAVEWDTDDGVRRGVYIPRRDTAALANVVVGGRLYPGEHHRARFRVEETEDRVRVAFTSRDDSVHVDVAVERAESLDGSVLFPSVEAASEFFRAGSDGYSATRGPRLDGLTLHTDAWRVEPARVLSATSSFFDGLPPGTAELDCALLMRGIPVRWEALDAMATA